MSLKFWTWGKKDNDEPEIRNVRTVGDIAIQVSTGLHGTRGVKVSGWNQPMAEEIFWNIWDGLVEREEK